MAREAKYPAQISALVPQDIRDRIDALEGEFPVSGGDVIREALAVGLASVEARLGVPHLEPMTTGEVGAYVAAGGEL